MDTRIINTNLVFPIYPDGNNLDQKDIEMAKQNEVVCDVNFVNIFIDIIVNKTITKANSINVVYVKIVLNDDYLKLLINYLPKVSISSFDGFEGNGMVLVGNQARNCIFL